MHVHTSNDSFQAGKERFNPSKNAKILPLMAGKTPELDNLQDTLVWDPFYTEMPEFFDMKLPDLLKQKHPSAWPEFERGEIDEDELYRKFFKDGRNINGAGLMRQMVRSIVSAQPFVFHVGPALSQTNFRKGSSLLDLGCKE